MIAATTAGRPPTRAPTALPLALTVSMLAAACSAPAASDLVQQVIDVRNRYEAQLNSWVIRDEGTPQERIYLDVLVINDNTGESLETLTVVVEQLDEGNEVLSTQRVVLDVAQLTPGVSQSIGVDVTPVAPGVEGIRLIVEPSPPQEDWDDFPEFEAVRPRI